MKRLFNPMLFLMANTPDVEKNFEMLMSMLQATTESVKNIKNGIDTFHAHVLKMAQATPGYSPTQAPPVQPKPPVQTPETVAQPVTSDQSPVIQMPATNPPVS